MASAEQVKALLQSHVEGDNQRFYSVAMQVAANEAKRGHGKLAVELRNLIDEAKSKRTPAGVIPLHRPAGDLADILSVSYPKERLGQLVLDEVLEGQLKRIIREQHKAAKIYAHGLSPRRKLLLVGPPGTGKTLTAAVLACELGLPLFQVRLDGLLTKFMGETAAKLRQIFDVTLDSRGVYFFDEFDAIGSHRGLTNDVGEIRRVLNSFLQMIEQDQSHSLIIAATNHLEILDQALFRRFDDVLHYELPDSSQIAELLQARLAGFPSKRVSWKKLADSASNLSHAEITKAADDVIKDALIDERAEITETHIRTMLVERRNIAQRLKQNS
jgi:SpoVK/Ycf46/Vps4 family AAA+-type ATPase